MIPTNYDPQSSEEKWYQYWLDHHYFHSTIDKTKTPYTIVIPPPNVTGVLHMGHMLNNTIQDVLIRRARLQGKNACWVPGTDHASIATEAKVVSRLAQQGIKKTDLSREDFLKHAWVWTEEHGGIILKQLRKLGASCDWDRTAFTMDTIRSESVIKVFVDLYNKGLIYRGVRMINWDPKALTALSDEEVVYKEEYNSKLYYLRYRIEGEEGYAVVATTRPETIMGDVAMCINPKDPKNQHLKGKKVIVPLVNRVIPVIEDDYVDIEFGTGCLKVTPAHDVNDYLLGEKYNLPSIDIFNENGTLSEAAGLYVGMDRFDVRCQIEQDLQVAGLLEKVEPYQNKVGYSERTNVPIEPKLSMQWFLKISDLARPALDAVLNDDIKFHPAKFKNIYRHWMENVKDWCISRQLWWGHRIPAWFLPEGGYVVATTPEEALEVARAQSANSALQLTDLRQEEDCLDTWFSSWLWPISLFNGINQPDNEELKYYYPTSDLVTGPDIIFFWVARMIMAGYEYPHAMPFKNVYFTGLVRDKQGRKMSKSLGNSPDPLQLIEQYGADGVRVGMLLCAPAGGDLLFDESLPEQGRNFTTKIWNAFRLVRGWKVANIEQPLHSRLALDWFEQFLHKSKALLNKQFEQYRLSEALMTVYTGFRDEFSSWLLEIIKPGYEQPIDRTTYEKTIALFEEMLQLLHPFMPFITEEIWQNLRERTAGESIMVSLLPLATGHDDSFLMAFEQAKEIIVGIRNIRKQNNIAFRETIELKVKNNNGRYPQAFESIICKMGNLSSVEQIVDAAKGAWSFIANTVEYFIPAIGQVDTTERRAKLEADLAYEQGFLANVMKKLNNEKFINGAPAKVIENERKKQADAEARIKAIEQQLAEIL